VVRLSGDALAAGLIVFALSRYGLFPAIVAFYFLHLMTLFRITSDFSAWYATDFVLAVIIGLGLAGFGSYTSPAGEPLFRGARLDDGKGGGAVRQLVQHAGERVEIQWLRQM
jgi:hypothetical protein